MAGSNVLTVTQLTSYLQRSVRADAFLRYVSIRGEISNCKYHYTGNIYFTLKDAGSQISCVMFHDDRQSGLRFAMKDGDSVIVTGRVDIYVRNGVYQLYARSIEKAGRGALYEQYEKLKAQMQAAGLFDEAHKKPLPPYPKSIGVVTASTGAAVHDIISVSRRRNPYIQIVFCPAQVQGKGAAHSIAAGIRALDRYGVDVIIAGRGGGSFEDLWEFNEPEAVYAFYNCKTPIISATGHETDFTLGDFAADKRAPTPSAAAELAVPDIRSVLDEIREYGRRLDAAIGSRLDAYRRQTEHYRKVVHSYSPERQLDERKKRLARLKDEMEMMMTHHISDARQNLDVLGMRLDSDMDAHMTAAKNTAALYAQKLEGRAPGRALARGYAYVTDQDGRGISSIAQVEAGDRISIAVTDGDIKASVEKAEPAGKDRTDNG